MISSTSIYGGDNITSEAYISSSADVRLEGASSVRLMPGFKSEAGAYFKASIESCIPGAWQHEYALKDHLGNTRVLFSDVDSNGVIDPDTEILDENHYYPFGMKIEGDWDSRQKQDNQYLYNSKGAARGF